MLNTPTRLWVSRGQQTWYRCGSIAVFRYINFKLHHSLQCRPTSISPSFRSIAASRSDATGLYISRRCLINTQSNISIATNIKHYNAVLNQ